MNKEVTNALQLLTGKASLHEVSVDELEQLVNEHPYFSAAQLLLCKKMQQAAHPLLQQQLYKTALYFPDERWLHFLLTDETETSESIDFIHQSEETVDVDNTKNEAKQNEILTGALNTDLEIFVPTEDEPTKTVVDEEVKNEAKQNEILPDNDAVNDAVKSEQNKNDFAPEPEDENLITHPAETVVSELTSEFEVHDEPEETPLDEEELQQQTSPLPIEESNQKIASLLSVQAEEFHKPLNNNTEVKVETEPLHAVDYFASQGIQVDEKKETTLFDKKVHKFTDWLRQMKRISPQPVDLGTDNEQEKYVANIADSSNYTKDVVTEAMAEVLVKQNKLAKAAEIYEKLSLLYPLKNAYFAAKIQQIKPQQ